MADLDWGAAQQFLKKEQAGPSAPTGNGLEERYPELFGPPGAARAPVAPSSLPPGSANSQAIPSQAALDRLRAGRVHADGPSAADYDRMSWGEYAPIVAKNALPSAWNAIKGMGEAVMHPVDTVTAVGKLGYGLGSKGIDAASEAIGYGPVFDPATKADREAVADALIGSYKGRYGGGEEGEFWKHLAEDPASYLTDAATFATAGVGAASKMGMVDKAGKLARAAELSANLDPVQAAMNATGKVANVAAAVPAKMLMGTQALASGLPMKVLQTARDLGLSGRPEQVSAFMASLKKNPNFNIDIVDRLENAIDEMADQASRSYMTSASTAFARSQPVDLTMPRAARDTVEQMIDPSAMNTVLRATPPYTAADIATARDAINQIDNALTHPNPAGRTIEELDRVKKNIDTLSKQITDPVLRSRVQAVSGNLVDAMGQTDPAYFDMMRGWQEYKRQLNNVRKDFGTERMSDAARARKLAKAFTRKDGDQMFSALEATPSGANLRYSIAGDAMSELAGDRIHNTLAGLGGPAAAALYAGFHPGVALAAVPGLAMASPKIGAYTQYGLGRAQGAINKAASGIADRFLPPVVTNVGSQLGYAMGEPVDAREGRKSGGRVGINHDRLADQLVTAAERAKKGISKSTEPLLNMPDDHIAHALEVANRSI